MSKCRSTEKMHPADNAPEGALDVWLRIPDGAEESDAEANIYPTEGGFIVEWCLAAVGLVAPEFFNSYAAAAEWLESEGFQDFSA